MKNQFRLESLIFEHMVLKVRPITRLNYLGRFKPLVAILMLAPPWIPLILYSCPNNHWEKSLELIIDLVNNHF